MLSLALFSVRRVHATPTPNALEFVICVTPFCGLVALQGDELVFDILESWAGIGLKWIWRASEQMHFLALDLWTAKLHSNS